MSLWEVPTRKDHLPGQGSGHLCLHTCTGDQPGSLSQEEWPLPPERSLQSEVSQCAPHLSLWSAPYSHSVPCPGEMLQRIVPSAGGQISNSETRNEQLAWHLLSSPVCAGAVDWAESAGVLVGMSVLPHLCYGGWPLGGLRQPWLRCVGASPCDSLSSRVDNVYFDGDHGKQEGKQIHTEYLSFVWELALLHVDCIRLAKAKSSGRARLQGQRNKFYPLCLEM